MNRRYCIFNLFLCMLIGVTGFVRYIHADETVHIVQKGETIYSIARSYKVTSEELMRSNGIVDPQRLQIGQHLRIPGTATADSGYIEYRVVKGETLYGIARRYEITVQELRNANNFADTYILKEGELLRIPSAHKGQVGSGPTQDGSGTSAVSRSITSGTVVPSIVADPRPPETRAGDTSLRWPIAAKEVQYMTGKLYGVALLGEKSETVRSLTQGTVVSAGPYRGFGRVAIVQVAGGYLYVYGGCERLSVKEGDRVTPGTELGRLGIDAVSKKPQLFFLVYQSNTPIDPAKAPRT